MTSFPLSLRGFAVTLSIFFALVLLGSYSRYKMATDGSTMLEFMVECINETYNRTNHNDSLHGDPPSRVDATRVMLLTYFRGGSSFLGEIFNQNDDAFYYFEPLFPFTRMPMFTNDIHFVEDSFVADKETVVRHIPEWLALNISAVATSLLQCDFYNMSILPFATDFMARWPKHRKVEDSFQHCLSRHKIVFAGNMMVSPQNYSTITKCLAPMQELCSATPLRVLKTIRVGVWMVEELLQFDPELKFVYYVRDPRGMLHSRVQMGWLDFDNRPRMLSAISQICAKLNDDAIHSQEYAAKHPELFFRFRYEDLAEDPMGVTSEIYRSLGIDAPREVTQWVRYASSASVKKELAMGTYRHNSTETAMKWREDFPQEYNELVLQKCRPFLEEFRYALL